ncbi:hypothetical protein F4821DRAFT_248970 [Hypoxylon rubiginosum]|uniref:Uncharacterized protein n=1 Tax=Hypoxylon rubiginosum TaxID=110542 RepID=A0ACC0CMJ1_9PEZI|nr:hypothetical protein F4821DRAFT_248970 [Hypoxylon rubiginosum]
MQDYGSYNVILPDHNLSYMSNPNTSVLASAIKEHEQATKAHQPSHEVLESPIKDEPDLAVASERFKQTRISRTASEDTESPIKHESNTALASLPRFDRNSPETMAESGTSEIEQSGKTQLDLKSLGLLTSPSIMLSRWLDSQKDDPNYTVLVKSCEDILQNQPMDGDETSPVASTPFNFPRKSHSIEAGSKRKASDMDASNGNSGALLTATETHSTTDIEKLKYACHFYKMNQHLYQHCGSKGYGTISSLGDHLRRQHGLKPYSCQACWRPFGNAESLAAHSRDNRAMSCRETKGTPPCRLTITKKHMEDDSAKWFWIWRKLFPDFLEPDSPHLLETSNEVDQYGVVLNQSVSTLLKQARREQMDRDELAEAILRTLARHHDNWVTNPPWPAPTPTPAATHGISAQDRLGVNHSVDESRNELQARFSNPYVIGLDTPSSWSGAVPSNTRIDTRPQQSVGAANNPSVDDNAVDVTGVVSSRVNEGTEDTAEWPNSNASDPETNMDQSDRDFLLAFSGVEYDFNSIPEWNPFGN